MHSWGHPAEEGVTPTWQAQLSLSMVTTLNICPVVSQPPLPVKSGVRPGDGHGRGKHSADSAESQGQCLHRRRRQAVTGRLRSARAQRSSASHRQLTAGGVLGLSLWRPAGSLVLPLPPCPFLLRSRQRSCLPAWAPRSGQQLSPDPDGEGELALSPTKP